MASYAELALKSLCRNYLEFEFSPPAVLGFRQALHALSALYVLYAFVAKHICFVVKHLGCVCLTLRLVKRRGSGAL
ncbi:MAG: hypothetical protein QW459_07475, partial [Sulfolobales archaeon]